MKILSAEQIRELDRFTIENEPISSFDLMERAANRCLECVLFEDPESFGRTVYICGKGNNGGDGLAMARIQSEEDSSITVIVLEHTEQGTAEFSRNLYLLEDEDRVEVVWVKHMHEFPSIPSNALIVDAILGTGLSRPLDGLLAEVVRHLNTLDNVILSVDMPTGLFADDNSGNNMDTIVRATFTSTFHCPKLSLLLPDTGSFAGLFEVADIGLMEKEMNPPSLFEYVLADHIKASYRMRPKFAHKGTFGHALVIAGSLGMMGAAQLATLACLRMGAGRVTAHVPKCGVQIMQIGVKEAMCSVDANHDHIIDHPKLSPFNAIAVGPGIGTDLDTANVVRRIIEDARVPLVMDADALNILAENRTWLSFLPFGTILTPHPKEFERLTGKSGSSLERLQMQIDFSKKYGVILVLKGAYTSISTPSGKVYFNSTGNPALATAGSGDVLTGIILGLLASGYDPEAAAIMGVYVHGCSGDLCVINKSEESIIASDIIDQLGYALLNSFAVT